MLKLSIFITAYIKTNKHTTHQIIHFTHAWSFFFLKTGAIKEAEQKRDWI